jgi:hypothetical protein
VETAALGFVSGLELLWADTTAVTVPSSAVLEILDGRRAVRKGQFATRADVFLDSFLLQASEERLSHGSVSAVSLSTHTWLKSTGSAKAPPRIAEVLHAFIQVHERHTGPPLLDRGDDGFQDRDAMNGRPRGPSHTQRHAARVLSDRIQFYNARAL